MYYNIEKQILQHKKYVLQHRKLCAATLKIMYCNISSSSTATSQKHLLQRPKNSIATFENNLLQHPKTLIATRKKQQKKPVQNSPWPITSSSLKEGIGPQNSPEP
jgi:hypothetical protein